ncbi:MAG: hypothetical protein EON96_03310, partial [Caulobacteraceae bacterium]
MTGTVAVKPPSLSTELLITDDAHRACAVSCALARPGVYFPVVDGPRMQRIDRDAEVVRRNNAVARARSETVFLAGLPDAASSAMIQRLPAAYVRLLADDQAIADLLPIDHRKRPPLVWGQDRIGVGLLLALRAGTIVVFEDGPSPAIGVPSRSGHLVICEAGEPLTEVIAANYAYSLRAGLIVIPSIDDGTANRLMDQLYRLFDQNISPTTVAEDTAREFRALCGGIDPPPGGSLTVFTRKLPLGLCFPEVPSTHLFTYPDAGLAVVNGFAAASP